MIKLYKDENKNKQLREIIAKVRVDKRPVSWKYCNAEEKAMDISRWHNCSYEMAKKVVWVLHGDCKRQGEICETLGEEYAMYMPSKYEKLTLHPCKFCGKTEIPLRRAMERGTYWRGLNCGCSAYIVKGTPDKDQVDNIEQEVINLWNGGAMNVSL